MQFDKYLWTSIYYIYVCRNLNHRGGEQTEKQAERVASILPNKSAYYLMFQGTLFSFVAGITKGISEDNLGKIKEWAAQLVNVKEE